MILPNFASRPFLNTRPVWLVTAASGALALVFVVLNIVTFAGSNRTLAPQLDHRDRLRAEKAELEHELRGRLLEMEKVPWRSLRARVSATNVVLREHGFSWSRLLEDIERIMPYDARLVNIGPTVGPEGVLLNLMVVARTRDAMLELLENMIADPSFSEPLPRGEKGPGDAETAGYELSMTVKYHPPEADA
jgi:hypothetical protein